MPEDHIHQSHPAIAARLKSALIHDHIDHCLSGGQAHDMAKIKALTKLL